MSDDLAEYSGPEEELAQNLLARALCRGGDSADLFIEERHSLSLRLEDRKIENAVSGGERGGSMRLTTGASTVFGYVDAVDEGSLASLATELSRSRSMAGTDVPVLTKVQSASGGAVEHDPRDEAAAAKARLLHCGDGSLQERVPISSQ